MYLSARRRSMCFGLALAAQVAAGGCGARTPLSERDAGVDAPPPCVTADDCPNDACTSYACNEGVCQLAQSVVCNDLDDCTADRCDPATGRCVFQPLTFDQDGDGFRGPRPGYAPGAPDACGEDCDDTSPKAFPGAGETCDGVDNDCNGVVDDGFARRVAQIDGQDAVRVSGPGNAQTRRGAFAYNGTYYAATYSGQSTRWSALLKAFDREGGSIVEETQIARVSSDNFAGGMVWTGAVFGMVWDDRRDGDYEVYFNRLDAAGNKLGPDLRLTNARDFSINSQIAWNGLEFVVVWEDRRDQQTRIFGQRVSFDGVPVGGNVALTEADWESESPVLALSRSRIGVAFTNRDGGIGFRSFGVDLSDASPLSVLNSQPAFRPALVHNGDRFVAAWEVYGDTGPGAVIRGAAVLDDGSLFRADSALTSGDTVARTPALFPLGDRVALVWSGDQAGNLELFTSTLSNDLTPLDVPARITFDGSESLFPSLAASADGSLGVLFEDRRSGAWQVYFSRLDCAYEIE